MSSGTDAQHCPRRKRQLGTAEQAVAFTAAFGKLRCKAVDYRRIEALPSGKLSRGADFIRQLLGHQSQPSKKRVGVEARLARELLPLPEADLVELVVAADLHD